MAEKQVAERLNQIDQNNVKDLGLMPQRFLLSMLQTYRELLGIEIGEEVHAEIKRCAESVLTTSPVLRPGSERMLKELKSAYRLIYYAAGDETIHRRKLEATALLSYFDAVFVCKHKNDLQLREIIDRMNVDVANSWMIGDSIKWDINPALRLGLRCVWVQSPSWGYGQEELVGKPKIVKEPLEVARLVLGTRE
jgi:putative hydrolase of the HAD superfamily